MNFQEAARQFHTAKTVGKSPRLRGACLVLATAQTPSRHLEEALVEGVAGAAHGADRVDGAAAVERLAQAADMHVDGALVDIDVAAPHAVEQLLAREHAAGALHEELEQADLGGPQRHLAAAARHAPALAVELDVA